jgi:serine/threonine-protein kinase
VIIEQRGPSKGVLIGGALAVLALAGGGAWFAMNAGPSPEEQVQIARTAVEQALPNVECSWLNIVGVQAGEPLSVRMTGVAGNPTGARNQITQAITAAGIEAANVSVEEVALIQPAGCSALQTYGKIRSNAAPAMSVAQREFETMRQSDGPTVARAKVQLNPPQGKDMALFGIEPKGLFSDMLSSRTALNEAVAAGNPKQIAPGVYEVTMDLDHTGWSGLILLTGDGPFDGTLTQPDVNARGPDWQSNFVATASEREWKAEMLWFKSVDKQPN